MVVGVRARAAIRALLASVTAVVTAALSVCMVPVSVAGGKPVTSTLSTPTLPNTFVLPVLEMLFGARMPNGAAVARSI